MPEEPRASAVTDVAEVETAVIQVIEDLVSDWDLDTTIDTQTKLVADLEFESIDVIQLVVALEERFRRRNLGFDQLLMVDGRYVDDLDVAAIVRFLSTRLAS